MSVFEQLAPFIQEYIYRHGWEELRDIQVAACDVIFHSDHHLLLSSGTASGKTEAAFLPTLTEITKNPSQSVAILYISPLRALINDQFKRLEDLLTEGHISVTKWHGEASRVQKEKVMKHPQGIIQITPESLESLLMNKRGACMTMFADLRYIIIDEVHHFMATPRGIQLQAQLQRLQHLIHLQPRRIGLSATLGDYKAAEQWLAQGTTRSCTTPQVPPTPRSLQIAMERFVIPPLVRQTNVVAPQGISHTQYLYQKTWGRKTIIFTRSRAEAESAIAAIRQVALEKKTADVYRVHHGNISRVLREETELDMKESEQSIVTGATVTLELGIDIGSLDTIVQIGSPLSVSSFTQRIGRSGRKGQPSQLIFTFLDQENPSSTDVMSQMHWDFLRTLAILQLYLEYRWVEPIRLERLPYRLVYHQTMSVVASTGEIGPAQLAQTILSLTPFRHVSQDDYRILLNYWLTIEHLEKTSRGGLILGRNAEGIVNDFEFFAVFSSSVDYLVKEGSRAIGTLNVVYPVGANFGLAGRTWTVEEIDDKAGIIYVNEVKGVSKTDWKGKGWDTTHTRIRQKMKEILGTDTMYPYLSESCKVKLSEMRSIAKKTGIIDYGIIRLSTSFYRIFPWVGTQQYATLVRLLHMSKIDVTYTDHDEVYIDIVWTKSPEELVEILEDARDSITSTQDLTLLPDDVEILKEKYYDFIPPELLLKEVREDYFDIEGLQHDWQVSFDFTAVVQPPFPKLLS